MDEADDEKQIQVETYTRTIQMRAVTFTCAHCGQETTIQQYPGYPPRYCVLFPILAPTCLPSSCLGNGSVAQRHDPGKFTIPRRGTDDRRQHPHYAAWLPLAHGSYHGNHARPCPSRVRAIIQTSAH
jgi:hypothetical protein